MNKALFLDRDGVVNVDHGYLIKSSDVEFVNGIFELCKQAKELGYLIVIVTNQSGIARGLYTEQQFQQLMQWMKSQFAEKGITLDGVYFCPHHPTKGQGKYLTQCSCRKPKPGMLLDAAQHLSIDLSASIMIGDKESDIEAAIAAGIEKNFLVSSCYHENSSILANHVQQISQISI